MISKIDILIWVNRYKFYKQKLDKQNGQHTGKERKGGETKKIKIT